MSRQPTAAAGPLSHTLGFPRVGPNRELKRAVEGYWAGQVDAAALNAVAASLRREHFAAQRAAGVDLIAVNDFSLYDHVLDTIALVGAVPPRFGWDAELVDLDTTFALARGRGDAAPLELTKWFDTNYHYLVPELWPGMRFRLASSKPFDALAEAQGQELPAKPVLLGPYSFLRLGRRLVAFDPLAELLDPLLEVYAAVVARLAEQGADWIALDEPCLALDPHPGEQEALHRAYSRMAAARGRSRLLLQTFFGHVADRFPALCSLPVQGLGLDFVRGRVENLTALEKHGFPSDRVLAAGLVDGRNVWATDLADALRLGERLLGVVDPTRLWVGPSSSLLHVPYDLALETDLPEALVPRLAFAVQKLDEVTTLTAALRGDDHARETVAAHARERARWSSVFLAAHEERNGRPSGPLPEVARRASPRAERARLQRARLNLPPLPTTTIGSFPQTSELRRQRRLAETGVLTREEYEAFLEAEIARVVRLQERLGVDVLVHGEPERTDMVEFFASQLEGFATTRHAWVQSYGTRCVRPPILWGDVARSTPLTLRWTRYAQSLTPKPMKGILTGPVTMVQWSFVREDQPRQTTCRQVALALRDEVRDLEEAGVPIVQVDEPALREGLPLRRAEWESYLAWAAECFRLATAGVQDATQVHTHMCYADFEAIAPALAAMDVDVVSLEAARSGMAFLPTVAAALDGAEVGPGVYDVHAPRVPSPLEIEALLERALRVLPPERLWVNPDCGLKTRRDAEVEPALQSMVQAARRLRQRLAGAAGPAALPSALG